MIACLVAAASLNVLLLIVPVFGSRGRRQTRLDVSAAIECRGVTKGSIFRPAKVFDIMRRRIACAPPSCAIGRTGTGLLDVACTERIVVVRQPVGVGRT